MFASGNSEDSIKMDLSTLDAGSLYLYREGVFHLLIYIPALCALVQLLVWARFSLHGKRLAWVKNVRSGATYAMV